MTVYAAGGQACNHGMPSARTSSITYTNNTSKIRVVMIGTISTNYRHNFYVNGTLVARHEGSLSGGQWEQVTTTLLVPPGMTYALIPLSTDNCNFWAEWA